MPPPAAPRATRADFATAAQAAIAATPCALLSFTAEDSGATIAGVLARGGETALRESLARSGVPVDAIRLRLQGFQGPYCPVLDALRPVLAAPDARPFVSLVGQPPLARGELLRLDIAMPETPSQLQLSYLTSSGDVAQLVPGEAQPAGARIRKGEPSQGFPGWEVDEPFGSDLLLVLTSDRPLFPQARPQVEPLADWLPALDSALRRIRQEGGRVAIRPVVVETVARR